MAKFKVVVSDPKTGTAKSVEIEGENAAALIGKKIGDIVDGIILGMRGVKLQIRGGSDNSGFPMRPDIQGGVKTRVLVSSGVGFRPKRKGERRKKTLRGNVITEDIVQINMVIVEK